MTPVAEQAIEQRALTSVEQAKLIVVTTLTTRSMAAEFGRSIAALEKEVTDFFKPMKDAAHKTHREICSKENQVMGPLTEAKQYLSRQIGTFDQEQERQRREEELRLQREAEAEAAAESKRLAEEQALADAIVLEAQGDTRGAEAVLNNPEPVPVYVPPVIVQRATIKTPGVTGRGRYKFRITNADAINRDYLMPDEQKIRQIVNALGPKAAAQIGGIEVYEERGASFRA